MAYHLENAESPPSNAPNRLKIQFGKLGGVEARLSVFSFIDHDYHVVYIPTLNLSAYGKTLQEAKDMLLNEVIVDFCENLIHLSDGEAFQHLSQLGWSRQGHKDQDFLNSAYVDAGGVLRNFNLPADTPIQQALVTV